MIPLRLFAVFGLGLFAWPGHSGAEDSGARRLDTLLFAHSVEMEDVDKAFRERIEKLNADYVRALEREAVARQQAGRLEDVLALRAEMEHVEEFGRPGEEAYPDHSTLRGKYAAAASDIERENWIARRPNLEKHIGELEDLKIDLTKAGDLETAVEVSRHLGDLTASLADQAANPVAAGAKRGTSRFVDEVVTDSPLHSGERFSDEVELKPGVYEFSAPVVIGDPVSGDPQPGTVEIPPGTTFRDGEMLVDQGTVTATESLFSEFDLAVDLGGSFAATACLFDRGRIRKGGAWTVRNYSAKWTFENCVFNGVFLFPLTQRPNGIKMTECTVIGVDIPPAEYYDTPVKESQHEWRQVERCLFVNCSIPESVLLMTEDCVFENCTFVPDIESVEPEKSARITLYFRNSPVEPPPGNNRVVFKGEPSLGLRKDFGATVKHDFSLSKAD
ncbi:MAG: hypothetical protein WD342_17085 [Verrucomicrobiales bacterium]